MLVGKQELMEEACSHLAMDVDVVMNTVELVVLVMAFVMVLVWCRQSMHVVIVIQSMITLLAPTPGVAVGLRFVDLGGGMSVTW